MSKILVNIHGAGKQMSNFYVESLEALGKIMGSQPECLPCWYADLCNVGSPVYGLDDPSLPPDALEFRQALRHEIRERRKAIESQMQSAADVEFGTLETMTIIADLVADVTGYLFNGELESKIRQRLRDVLAQAAQRAGETVLVSHSLGTVVAFDVLREEAQHYRVAEFITMGSPLLKLVRLGRRAPDTGKINRQTVRRWRNLYDTTDPVADAIGPAMPTTRIEDIYIQVADAPVPSHDYWRNADVLTLIAETLQ